jgi:putative tricarboxylic transport membrane protein
MKNVRKLHPGETVISWLLLAFSAFVLYQAIAISGFSGLSTPGAFPVASSAIMTAAMLWLVVQNLRIARRRPKQDTQPAWVVMQALLPLRILLFTLLIVAYMLLLQPLGFLISTFVFLCSGFIYLRGSTPLRSVVIAAVAVVVIYGLFNYLFRVVLP